MEHELIMPGSEWNVLADRLSQRIQKISFDTVKLTAAFNRSTQVSIPLALGNATKDFIG